MDLFEIGKIVKPHGLGGRMKVILYLESNTILESLKEVYVGLEKQETNLKKIKNIKISKKHFLLELEGVENIVAASALVGCQVLVPSEKLEKLSGDEYYWRDIIGLEVVTEDGEIIGRVESILPTGSNDVYVCTSEEKEILLPAIADVVRKIDIKNGRMVVRLLKGL
ncbi:MAG: ribosome maturation factor RimM [Syntrophales bacterium]|nr:ribosome maturation factor RimM [Syntrophales bacterium]